MERRREGPITMVSDVVARTPALLRRISATSVGCRQVNVMMRRNPLARHVLRAEDATVGA